MSVYSLNFNEVRDKLNAINNYLIHSNCSDFRIKNFNGCNLNLIGSFDLFYYHEIEVIFYEVSQITMETLFNLDLTESQFRLNILTDELLEIFIIDDSNIKQSISCENIDFNIDTVKYYDIYSGGSKHV